MTNNIDKNVEYYLNLPWTYTIEKTNETGASLYIVMVNELPYLTTDASSIDEAMKQIKEVMAHVFSLDLENNETISLDRFLKNKINESNIHEKSLD